MSRGSNPKLNVGDILLDTSTRTSLRVLRLIGNNRVEVVGVATGSTPQIVDAVRFVRGIASGSVQRIASTHPDNQ